MTCFFHRLREFKDRAAAVIFLLTIYNFGMKYVRFESVVKVRKFSLTILYQISSPFTKSQNLFEAGMTCVLIKPMPAFGIFNPLYPEAFPQLFSSTSSRDDLRD